MKPLYSSKEQKINNDLSISNLLVVPTDETAYRMNVWMDVEKNEVKMGIPWKVGDLVEFTGASVSWDQKTSKHPYWKRVRSKYARIMYFNESEGDISISPLEQPSMVIKLDFEQISRNLSRPSDKTVRILFGKPT